MSECVGLYARVALSTILDNGIQADHSRSEKNKTNYRKRARISAGDEMLTIHKRGLSANVRFDDSDEHAEILSHLNVSSRYADISHEN